MERVKAILLSPKPEWERIKLEPLDKQKLYVGYLLPLALVAALASAIGMSVFGVGALGFTVKVGIVPAFVSGVVQVVMTLVGAFVLALVVDWLAPNFGTAKNPEQAHKLAVYSGTAGLVAGVFAIFPPLGMLSILGLYSVVLFYLGLPRLMGTPDGKRVPYMAAIFVVCLVLGIVAATILNAVRTPFMGAGGTPFAAASSRSDAEVEITLPGGGKLKLNDMEKAANAFSENMAGVAAAGGGDGSGTASIGGAGKATDPAKLAGMLPNSLPGGYQRTSLSSSGAMGASQAEAVYQKGDSQITLQVMDMGAMGAFASMAGAVGIQENTETEDGYSRTRTVKGRVISESFTKSSKSASYDVVGKGVMIGARGSNVDPDDLRRVVEAIDVEKLEKAIAK
jgi:hypothetical protein